MVFEVRIPSLGESVSEGVIARWAREEGETVGADDVLLELETDKASMEIPADRAGVLHILRAAGETVAVGDVVATIDEAGGAAAPKPRTKAAAKEMRAGAPGETASPAAPPPRPTPTAAVPSTPSPAAS